MRSTEQFASLPAILRLVILDWPALCLPCSQFAPSEHWAIFWPSLESFSSSILRSTALRDAGPSCPACSSWDSSSCLRQRSSAVIRSGSAKPGLNENLQQRPGLQFLRLFDCANHGLRLVQRLLVFQLRY